MRRSEEQPLAIGEEPRTSGLAVSVRDALEIRPVDAHHVLLVARATVARGLEGEPLSIAAKIRFGVFTTERDLPDIGEVRLTCLRRNRSILPAGGRMKRRHDNRGGRRDLTLSYGEIYRFAVTRAKRSCCVLPRREESRAFCTAGLRD